MQLPESPGIFQYQLCTCLAHSKVQEDVISIGLFCFFLKTALKGVVGLLCVNNQHFQGAQGWGNLVAAVFYPLPPK